MKALRRLHFQSLNMMFINENKQRIASISVVVNNMCHHQISMNRHWKTTDIGHLYQEQLLGIYFTHVNINKH